MSSTPNTIDDIKLTTLKSEAAITSIQINGTLKHDDNEDAVIDAEEQFIFSSSDFDAANYVEDLSLETHLQQSADFIVIHDAATDITNNNISSTPKVNFVGGNNVSVVKLNSSDNSYGAQSVDLERFSKACSLEVAGAQYTNFDENVPNEDDDNEGDIEVVVNFLGKVNHIVRLNDFFNFLFGKSIRE